MMGTVLLFVFLFAVAPFPANVWIAAAGAVTIGCGLLAGKGRGDVDED